MPPVEPGRGRVILICPSWHAVAARPFCYSSIELWRFPRLAAQKGQKVGTQPKMPRGDFLAHFRCKHSQEQSLGADINVVVSACQCADASRKWAQSPYPWGSSQKKWGFLAGKLLSIAFSGLRLEAPRKSTGVDSLWLDSGWHPRCLMTTGYYASMVPPWVGAKMDESSIYGKFHWTHKSDFFHFSIGVPIRKKKSRDEIATITEAGKIP